MGTAKTWNDKKSIQNICLAFVSAFIMLLSKHALAAEVHVIYAHYGFNCGANGIDYDTDNLRQHCKGKPVCHYTIKLEEISEEYPFGKLYPGCAKAYNAEYSCGGTAEKMINVPAPAEGAAIVLSCP